MYMIDIRAHSFGIYKLGIDNRTRLVCFGIIIKLRTLFPPVRGGRGVPSLSFISLLGGLSVDPGW